MANTGYKNRHRVSANKTIGHAIKFEFHVSAE
jgi:hypothetical protein